MPRKVFFSFHFANDFWRTQQVRNINALEGNSVCTANAWEEVKKKGSANIEKWIDDNMKGKSCVVVLVGSETSERKWVTHEISKGWNDGRGVLGIRIHKLLDSNGNPSTAGGDPMDNVTFTNSDKSLSGIAPLKSPAGSTSREVYASICNNIESWIEEAIRIRNGYSA